LIDFVGHAVGVVVIVGAAVFVGETVFVLGLERAAVGRVGYAVAVVVGLGAAVGVVVELGVAPRSEIRTTSPALGLDTSKSPSGVTARNRALSTRATTRMPNPAGTIIVRGTSNGAVAA
jgi:hypothetical protein